MAATPPLPVSAPAQARTLWEEDGFSIVFGGEGAGWELPPERIVLALNRSGRGAWEASGTKIGTRFEDRTAAFGYTGSGKGKALLRGSRVPDAAASFLTLSWTRAAFRQQIREAEQSLPPEVRAWLAAKAPRAAAGAIVSLSPAVEFLHAALIQPPVAAGAAALWYRGKALELLALFLLEKREPQEMFCSRQNRVSRERVEKTMQILQAHLSDPPDLESLGSQVGCSPFYLSRLFSRETKSTIPQYVRELRMNRAAELLRAGTHNVTEAAMEVGYSSLSHFSKAFWEKFGCCPGLYPNGARLFSRHNRRAG